MPLFQLRLAGYGLLVIGLINLLLRGAISPASFSSAPARLTLAHGLASFAPWLLLSLALIFVQGNRQRRTRETLPVTLLHRLLMPLVVGYLLLVPLMVRDAFGYNSAAQGQFEQQLALYRSGSSQLQDKIRPLRTPLEVARTLQQYPNISLVADPADSADLLKRKLAEALRNGEAQLRGRYDDVSRQRNQGLAQRTLESSLVCLVVAAGLAVLRLQNLSLIEASGKPVSFYFGNDLLPEHAKRRRRRASNYPEEAFPNAWIMAEGEEEPEGSNAHRS
jgi:hypothetical protein